MSNKYPDYRAHLGRHGHNLTHDFSFTSGTGHLLTVFSEIMYPKDTIKGRCDMFTRTQPLLNPANVEIDEFIDYFFVPLDMLWSGFGDYLYQINEPYSGVTKSALSNMSSLNGDLPVYNFISQFGMWTGSVGTHQILGNVADWYGKDWAFFSFYRNLFHNGINPNSLFAYSAQADDAGGASNLVYPADMFQPNVLPVTLMAYNACYQHVYRLDDRETFFPATYNIDEQVYNNTGIFPQDSLTFSLKYRPKHLDYFMDVKPSPFLNTSNMLVNGSSGLNLTVVNDYLSQNNIRFLNSDNTSSSVASSTQLMGSYTNPTQTVNTTMGIRNLFAVEKILGITQRARKTYDAQVLAHLGVDVPHDVLHEIIKVGTQHSQIRIGEVISTAGTSNTPLGDIAGKGYSVMSNDDINFTAPCHGVFIGIYSALPRFRYYVPLEKRNCISNRLDFFTPEFEKLGMQPVMTYEACPMWQGVAGSAPVADVLGWQMRYEQYKRRVNKVSPAFVDTIVATLDSNIGFDNGQNLLQTFNSWHNWTLVRRPYTPYWQNNQCGVNVSLGDFLCGADELNGLMAVDYWNADDWKSDFANNTTNFYKMVETSSTPEASRTSLVWNLAQLFYRDPLVHFCKPNFKVINKMCDNTLPDFIV